MGIDKQTNPTNTLINL